MRKFLLAALLLPALFLVSCQKQIHKEQENNTTDQTLADLLQNLSVNSNRQGSAQFRNGAAPQSTFKLLYFAIARAGLAGQLNNANAVYTLFAPTDEAFAAIGLGTQQAINQVPVETLKSILQYHVLGSKVLAAQVPMTQTELTMENGAKAYVNRSAAGVFINGNAVVAADIIAKNGVLHAIDKVLLPPAGTIVDIAVSNPNFTYLVEAVQKAGLVGALNGSGPLTVFAPTNDAFIAAGFPTIQSIQSADAAVLTQILLYHVTAGRVFSSDLVNNMQVTMLNNQLTTILLGSGAQIDGTGSAPSNITQVNILATNGVIHVIDRVLLP